MYVCMYVCMYVYMYVYMYVCMYICMYICMYYFKSVVGKQYLNIMQQEKLPEDTASTSAPTN